MEALRPKLFGAACILFLLSLSMQYGSSLMGAGHPVQSIIVEESSQRSSLSVELRSTLNRAGSLGIDVIDQDVTDSSKKTPAELVPFIKAAQTKVASGGSLPQLTRKWSNGRTTSVACPYPLTKLEEATK